MAAKISKVVVLILLLVACRFDSKAQDTTVMVSNNEYSMELHRQDTAVSMVIYLTNPAQFATVIVETGRWSDGAFRQCAYADLDTSNGQTVPIDGVVDYPLTPYYDAYYRLKLVRADGSEKVFTPVRLPAKYPDKVIF